MCMTFLLLRIYGGKHEKRYSDKCNFVRAKMSEGLEVVKDQIADEFNSPNIDERYDVDSQSVDLYFSAEAAIFRFGFPKSLTATMNTFPS
jgi:hypothetical protein